MAAIGDEPDYNLAKREVGVVQYLGDDWRRAIAICRRQLTLPRSGVDLELPNLERLYENELMNEVTSNGIGEPVSAGRVRQEHDAFSYEHSAYERVSLGGMLPVN